MDNEAHTAHPDIRPKRRRRFRRANQSLVILVFIVGIFSYLTNPFTRFSVIKDPFFVSIDPDNQLTITPRFQLEVYDDKASAKIAEIKSGWHIFVTRVVGGTQAHGKTIPEIIARIHALRFNPSEPYIISGDHFSVLYPRSLGIFYNSILDPRTAINQTDWEHRQIMYLKTTAYALETFSKSDRMTTTIVPVGPREVSLLDIYSPASDTLYSILYALAIMTDKEQLSRIYPYPPGNQIGVKLQTKKAAETLMQTYKTTLERHYDIYINTFRDPATGLINNTSVLSGTKDSVERTQAFYDNVILWRTIELAQRLGIAKSDPTMLAETKKRILEKFWTSREGYFLEELGSGAVSDNYSSDWLIAVMTGFLDLSNPIELEYAKKSVEYIQANKLDQPFGLKYQPQTQKDTLHVMVKLFAPSYASSAIWSHWGMEYTKLLTRIYQETCDIRFLTDAERQITAYSRNIETYQGFPELYDEHGRMFVQTLYKSVRGTGWVVNFEETKAMVESTRNQLSCKEQPISTPAALVH